MSSKDLKTRFDSRFCRMNCQMTVSAANCLCGQNSARSAESCATFRSIFCHDISEFESYHLSQPVWSLCPMSGSQKYWRDSRELRGRRGVSWTKFSGALGLVGEIRAPVFGREFSISVLRGERLGSKWHESGSHRRLSKGLRA